MQQTGRFVAQPEENYSGSQSAMICSLFFSQNCSASQKGYMFLKTIHALWTKKHAERLRFPWCRSSKYIDETTYCKKQQTFAMKQSWKRMSCLSAIKWHPVELSMRCDQENCKEKTAQVALTGCTFRAPFSRLRKKNPQNFITVTGDQDQELALLCSKIKEYSPRNTMWELMYYLCVWLV